MQFAAAAWLQPCQSAHVVASASQHAVGSAQVLPQHSRFRVDVPRMGSKAESRARNAAGRVGHDARHVREMRVNALEALLAGHSSKIGRTWEIMKRSQQHFGPRQTAHEHMCQRRSVSPRPPAQPPHLRQPQIEGKKRGPVENGPLVQTGSVLPNAASQSEDRRVMSFCRQRVQLTPDERLMANGELSQDEGDTHDRRYSPPVEHSGPPLCRANTAHDHPFPKKHTADRPYKFTKNPVAQANRFCYNSRFCRRRFDTTRKFVRSFLESAL